MCIYTKYIINPKYRANKKNHGKPPKCDDMRKYYVPVKCGHCIECRKQKQREWVIRLSEEIRNHTMKFVTLTIDEEHMAKLKTSDESPNNIATKALRLFLERVRKETKKSIRHWCVTELGEEKGRIHLHGFFECKADTIAKHWKYGFIFVGRWVNERSIFYMTKYMLKECPYNKHFIGKVLCSKGIGSGYTKRLDAKRNKYQPGKTKETYRLRDGKPFCKQSPCPACGKIREEIKKETPADLKGIYFGRFRAMSKEQKQESLKRRSHEHFKKKIAPERHAKLAAVRAEAKSMLKK